MQINPEKCAVLRIGTFRDESDARYYTMKKLFWSPTSIKILGIRISPRWEIMHRENYKNMLEKVQNIYDTWAHRGLTPIGKIAIVNSLTNTLFVHKFLAIPSPSQDFFRKYKKMTTEFIWNGKKARISYEKMIQGYGKLGLKLVDLETKDLALKAAWPARWKIKEVENDWFYTQLPIKDSRIWECNLRREDVVQLGHRNTLCVSISILEAWSRFNFKKMMQTQNAEEILHENIYGNSLITRKGRPIFDRKLLESNIDKIIDIYHIEGKRFNTYQETRNEYGMDFDMLYYCGMLSAIPPRWNTQLITLLMLDGKTSCILKCQKKNGMIFM